MPQDPLDQFVQLQTARDAMSATLTILPGLPAELRDERALTGLLRARCLAVTPETSALLREGVARAAADPDNPHTFEVARGEPPRHGTDGRLEFAAGLDPRERPAGADGSGNADHYNRSDARIVQTGQTVGRIVPPTPGAEGRDVFGKVLAAKDGKPVEIRLDGSVVQREDGTLLAGAAGALDFRGSLLRITRHMVVPGDVDFATGNVRFPGDVTVEKGVRDLFEVHAEGSLTVRGVVEMATLTAGADADLAGGMAARERGSVHVWRDLAAKYLNNVLAVVGRNLRVERELVNCHIVVGGTLAGEGCAVSGGVVCAGRGCEVGQLGSASGVSTVLVLGRITELEDLLDRAAGLREEVDGRVGKARARLEQLKGVVGKRTASQAEELTELEFNVAQAMQRSTALATRMDRLRGIVERHARAELIVRKRIFPGVRLWAGRCVAEIDREIRGPVRIFTDGRGRLRLVDLGTNHETELVELVRVLAMDRYEGPRLEAGWPEPTKKAA